MRYMHSNARWSGAALMLLAIVTSAGAVAQDYPSRPIRYVVPFPAGGGVDIVARLVAQKLTERWGQQVVVDNRAGASGVIGADAAAKATPDGYTLVMGNVATHAVNAVLIKKLPYDPVADFAPVTQVAMVPAILLLNPSVPANSVKELIDLARAKPGQLTYGSAGFATPPQMAAELFKLMAHVDILHVPYKGGTPGLIDLMGGQITMFFSNIVAGVPLVKSGKLKALAVTSPTRSKIAPELPTIAEAGLPGYEEMNWYGVLTTKGTPDAIVGKLNREIVRILNTPEIRERIAEQGAEVTAGTPQEFGRFIRQEIDKYAKLVKAGGIRPE